jgi:hypothetical protein
MHHLSDPRDIAAHAATLVTGDRGSDYGHPLDNLGRAAAIWSVILGCDVSAEQVALCMVGVKIAREVNPSGGGNMDTVVDGIGYFLTLAMVREERALRERESST